MSNTNSIVPYTGVKLKALAESMGITQFPDATSWYQIIGGLIFQGGKVSVLGTALETVPFVAPYEKQLLGIWTQVLDAAGNNHHVTNAGLTGFDIQNGAGDRDFYWWSIGV